MTWLFLAMAVMVVVGTALALAGRWQPEGMPQGEPDAAGAGSPARFDVVLRGYRMDQVDAELARLHQLLGDHRAPSDELSDEAREHHSES